MSLPDNMDPEAVMRAVELHEPVKYDKYARVTTDVQQLKWLRCNECSMNVPENGCKTWRVANGG